MPISLDMEPECPQLTAGESSEMSACEQLLETSVTCLPCIPGAVSVLHLERVHSSLTGDSDVDCSMLICATRSGAS